MKEILFVYGTLKQGFKNNYIIRNCKYLGNAKTLNKGILYIFLNIPYLKFDENGDHIQGELYEIDDYTLDMTDELEGHPLVYKRVITPVILNDEILYTYVYEYQADIKNEKFDKKTYNFDIKNDIFNSLDKYAIFYGNNLIDEVYYPKYMSIDNVKKSLIKEYNHTNDISVYKIKENN